MSNFKFQIRLNRIPISHIIQKNVGILIILLLGLIPLVSLFHPGLPITHDGQDHVARIANFYQSLIEGNIIPRWAANLNWGFGHPILMFLYPFPSYLAALFHFLGFSLIDSVKLVFGITYIGSGITMYLWMRNYMGKKIALVAGFLYMFAPYRFVDLYVRGAIGEHVAFFFMPLILYFLLKLSQKRAYKYFVGGSFSLAGLLLSHNAISIMFLPFIFFYVIFLWYQNKKKRKELFLKYLALLMVGVGLSAFFLFPAFFEGKYTLRDIVTGNQEYAASFIKNPLMFFWGPWSYGGSQELSKQIGVIQTIGIVFSCLFFLKTKKKEQKIFWISLFLYFVVSLFLMISASQFIWQAISILQKFQFPWRFLTIIVFASAVLAGIGFAAIKKFTIIVICLVFLFTIILYKEYWYPKGYLYKSEDFFTNTYNSTTDTGESSPKWSVRFMEKRPTHTIELLTGKAEIKSTERSSTQHTFSITAQEKSRIKDNTVYFPGWNVYIDGQLLPSAQIEFQDQLQRGLITFWVPEGIHTVSVKFEDTRIRSFSNIISLFTVFGVIIGGIYGIFKKRIVS